MSGSVHFNNQHCKFPHSTMLSILIEHVDYDDAYNYLIDDELKQSNIGRVDHIDWIIKNDTNNELYYTAYVYVKHWFDNEIANEWKKEVGCPCFKPGFEGKWLGKWYVKKNSCPLPRELIQKEQNLYLLDRINHLEQMHTRKHMEINESLEQLNEKIYLLGESFGEILLKNTPVDTSTEEPVPEIEPESAPIEESEIVSQIAGGAGPALLPFYDEIGNILYI